VRVIWYTWPEDTQHVKLALQRMIYFIDTGERSVYIIIPSFSIFVEVKKSLKIPDKAIIKIRKSKTHNGQKKKDKQNDLQNVHMKLKI
jgi:hypothetical protein